MLQVVESLGNQDHLLVNPIRDLVATAVGEGRSPEWVAAAVLSLLDANGLVRFAPPGTLALLTPPGRALVALIERPSMSQRDLAVYLGVSESGVAQVISRLVRSNLIARTKVKGRNLYHLNREAALDHPELVRFLRALLVAVAPEDVIAAAEQAELDQTT